VFLQALDSAMDARYSQEEDTNTGDVTAVTSEPADTAAQRRADALTAAWVTNISSAARRKLPSCAIRRKVFSWVSRLDINYIYRCEQ